MNNIFKRIKSYEIRIGEYEKEFVINFRIEKYIY